MGHLIAIVGPTAVGKSKLALELAADFEAEIVNADSRQVYRYMDIGTNKPTREEQRLVPHHLIDVVNPDDDFTLAGYLQGAYRAIADIQQRGKLPLLVGGSGLYVWSLLEGWIIPGVPPDRKLRQELEATAEELGGDILYQRLCEIDPAGAAKIDPRNIRRLIRALEIYQSSGQLPSAVRRKRAPDFSTLIIGLTIERSKLYGRIDSRVDRMMEEGLVKEVTGLMQRGYSLSLPSMSGIGYKQVGDFLSGRMSLSGVVEKIKYETHRLARRQCAWFRPEDARIRWLDATLSQSKAAKDLITSFLP